MKALAVWALTVCILAVPSFFFAAPLWVCCVMSKKKR